MTQAAGGKKPLVETLLVAGVGLIGGSLALAAKERGLVGRVVGLGRTRANLEIALKRGILDHATQDPAEAAGDADLVMLAVPVRSTAAVAAKLLPHLPEKVVLTDAGSVKTETVGEMDGLVKGTSHPFVGAHPVAGTEESGASAASAGLFSGKRCIITPGDSSTLEAVSLVTRLWEQVGMKVEKMPPAVHDRIFSLISHLPHMLAFALVRTVSTASTSAGSPLRFAGSSFADVTRVAASLPEMWRDICLANRPELLEGVDEFCAALGQIRAAIERSDGEELEKIFTEARAVKRSQGGD